MSRDLNGRRDGAGNGNLGAGGDELHPRDGGRGADRLAALVMAALVAFNPPVLRAFGAGDAVFGLPLIYLYVLGVWAAVIVAAALLLDRGETADDKGGEP